MALDEFTDGDEDLNLEDMEIDFRPYNAEVEEGTQIIYSAATLIQDQMVVVELDEPIERSIMEQGNTDVINQKVAQQLAQDHLWNRLNHETVLVEEDEHEKVLEDDSVQLEILELLYQRGVSTRSDLEEVFDREVRHDQMKALERKKLISHIGKDGRAHIYTTTPRGARELLDRRGYGGVTPSEEEEADEEDESEETEPDESQTNIEDQL